MLPAKDPGVGKVGRWCRFVGRGGQLVPPSPKNAPSKPQNLSGANGRVTTPPEETPSGDSFPKHHDSLHRTICACHPSPGRSASNTRSPVEPLVPCVRCGGHLATNGQCSHRHGLRHPLPFHRICNGGHNLFNTSAHHVPTNPDLHDVPELQVLFR